MVAVPLEVEFEVEVPGIVEEKGVCPLGPFEGKDPRGLKEVFEEEVVEIGWILDAIGIAMNELTVAVVDETEIKAWAVDGFADAEAPGEPAHEGGLPGTEIPVEGENGIIGQGGGEGLSERLGFLRRPGPAPGQQGSPIVHPDFRCW